MKNSSALILGLAIIVGFTILGFFQLSVSKEDYRYDLISANENNIIIFDKETGEYWNKFIPSNEGPTDWEKGESPIKSGNK